MYCTCTCTIRTVHNYYWARPSSLIILVRTCVISELGSMGSSLPAVTSWNEWNSLLFLCCSLSLSPSLSLVSLTCSRWSVAVHIKYYDPFQKSVSSASRCTLWTRLVSTLRPTLVSLPSHSHTITSSPWSPSHCHYHVITQSHHHTITSSHYHIITLSHRSHHHTIIPSHMHLYLHNSLLLAH